MSFFSLAGSKIHMFSHLAVQAFGRVRRSQLEVWYTPAVAAQVARLIRAEFR
jgi:hypothetical protein